jgi:hypothetical protein
MEVDEKDFADIPWFVMQSEVGINIERTIPQVFPVPNSMRRFYQRECYLDLYEKIKLKMQFDVDRQKRVNPVMCAAVFGTPGIGKSVFEFYFLSRYISEHPDHFILLTSWKNFQVQEIFLYNPKQSNKFVQLDKLISGVHLHLCDGAPNLTFPDPTICFTSPNFTFFDKIIGKERRKDTFVMPNWTEDELIEANAELGLEIQETELEDRFQKYGPIARVCLENDKIIFQECVSRIENGLNKINNWMQVGQYFEVSLERYQGSEDLVHRLFKIEPDDTHRKCRIEFASNYLAEQIRKRLNDISLVDRKQLYDWLGSSGLASSFRGFLYEEFCHSCILKGFKLRRRKINEDHFSEDEEIFLEKSDNARFSKLANISPEASGYFIPISRCLKSIDSLYHRPHGNSMQRMLFQMTIQQSGHAVDADGLVDYLEAMKIYDLVEKNPQMISINLVIPSFLDSRYNSPQQIKGVQSKNFPKEVNGLQGFGNYGIRKKSLKRILNMGIRTVDELKLKFQTDEEAFSFEKVRLKRLFADMDVIPKQLDFLMNIPQYVIHLDVE